MSDYVSKFNYDMQNTDKILVYGAGFIANVVYKVMKHYELHSKIQAFIVRSCEGNPLEIGGIKVEEYVNYINGNEKIVLGVSDEKQDEICLELKRLGIVTERIYRIDRLMLETLIYEYSVLVGSAEYWEQRYKKGGNSGAGSYNHLAEFKAEVLNQFVKEKQIDSIIEWGCGDGNQLSLAEYPLYFGYDVSKTAIEICNQKFEDDKTKKFIWCGEDNFTDNKTAELVLSLDVLYHLLEDDVYENYMKRLFASSEKYVCIYSSNYNEQTVAHVKHRKFTEWITENMSEKWKLIRYIKNKYPFMIERENETSKADFYFYEKMVE